MRMLIPVLSLLVAIAFHSAAHAAQQTIPKEIDDLRKQVAQLTQENAQLRLANQGLQNQVNDLRKELDGLKGADGSPGAVTLKKGELLLVIDSIQAMGFSPRDQGELETARGARKSLEQKVQKAHAKLDEMQKANSDAFNAFDHHDWPYTDPKKPFEKPYKDDVLSRARMELGRAEDARDANEATIKRLERAQNEDRYVLTGHLTGESAADPNASATYEVIVNGPLAQRVKKLRAGSAVVVNGAVVESSAGVTRLEAKQLREVD